MKVLQHLNRLPFLAHKALYRFSDIPDPIYPLPGSYIFWFSASGNRSGSVDLINGQLVPSLNILKQRPINVRQLGSDSPPVFTLQMASTDYWIKATKDGNEFVEEKNATKFRIEGADA